MKQYDTGLSVTVSGAVVIAVVVVAGLFAATMFLPNGGTSSTTTVTTEPTEDGFGIKAAEYLNSRRDDVEFYWLCNCTLVNEDITEYYQLSDPSAFVDGIKMWRVESGGNIEVLFSPYDVAPVGQGTLTTTEWESLAGSIIDNGLAMMDDAEGSYEFPTTWPIRLHMGIFFDDGTVFYMGYTSSDNLVWLNNGTWSGFSENGHPIPTGYSDEDHWLNEGGYLATPISDLFTAITENVEYPTP